MYPDSIDRQLQVQAVLYFSNGHHAEQGVAAKISIKGGVLPAPVVFSTLLNTCIISSSIILQAPLFASSLPCCGSNDRCSSFFRSILPVCVSGNAGSLLK